MKKYLLGLGLIFGLISTTSAQQFSYGLKGGVNYTMGGEIRGERSGVNSNGEPNHWNGTAEGSSQIGFHGGAFLQVNFGKFFLRPEVVYTSIALKFDFPKYPTQYHTPKKASLYEVQKFDIPFMIGYNVWGPVDIYAGPVYSNILSSTLEGEEVLDEVVAQNTPINLQGGVKAEFGRFGLDLRYEHSLSTPETQNLDLANGEYGVNRAYFEDSRINQVILSVIFKIGGPGLNEGRRRKACY
ncbi:outer membrane beta-barrel protein [Salinimicrobium soli]|uniref:outer membrane beta-barrel protein n=2 Tax=Bacteria TaxID=2 RepID=UPI003AAC51EA